MEISEYIIYSVFFAVILMLSFLINYLFLKFSKTWGTRNNEQLNQIRWKSEVKPSLGGFSFFIAFLVSFSVLNVLPYEREAIFSSQIIGVLAASTLGFLIGLADDAYNTNPLVKFIGQLTCAFILIVSNVYIDVTGFLPVDYGITVVWVIGLMNSINMLDNMDGITAGASMSILLAAIVFILTGNTINGVYMLLLLGVFGSLLTFLYFNWSPAKMYMGDTGSQFLGVFLAAISIIFFWREKDVYGGVFQVKQFVIPMLIFIVPLVDTITVTIRRLMRKQSPFVGGRDHTTHHLVFFGFSEKQTSTILLLLSLFSIPVATALHHGYINWTLGVTVAAIIYFFIVLIGMQIVYEIGKKRQAAKLQND